MVKEEIIGFLKNIPPFNMVDEEELSRLTEEISLEYYPKGLMILRQNGPPSEYLNIIKKGAVKLYVLNDEEQEIVIDYRGEGESFGFISMFSGDRSRANIQAIEDTLCYQIPKEALIGLMQKSTVANQYFVKSFFLNFIDKTYEETRKRFSLIGQGDRLLFTTTVGELIRRQPICVSTDTSIRETAQIMSREKISSVVVVTENNIPVGIVTDKDLREKVIARGLEPEETISTIMSSPVIKVDSSELGFEALLRMIRYNIHHLVVVEDGELKGVISNHDFMLLQGNSPTVLVKDIEKQQDFDSLKDVKRRLLKIVSLLLREGARAYNITGLITEVYERLINKLIDLIKKRIGPSPVDYSLFIYGSGGRREFTLIPDISIGVVLEDTFDLNLLNASETYFTELMNQLESAFKRLGLSYEKQEVLSFSADNIKTKKEWLNYLRDSIKGPFQLNPAPGLIEMRCIRGDSSNVESLRSYMFEQIKYSEEFMDYLATLTVNNRPPLGFLKRFVVEKSGEHKDQLNLYLKGIKPIIDSTRVLSLKNNIRVRPTFKRLKELGQRYGFELADDLNHAIDYLYTLLIHEQITQVEAGLEPTVFINPEGLGNFEKKTLKEAFQLTVNIYDLLEKTYRTERV
ncbi:MAG: CBS domain-containing protein [Nitrospirae bacterium]|nr:MAG: CBS domain-containing protein [Nitrospirota bacterium]